MEHLIQSSNLNILPDKIEIEIVALVSVSTVNRLQTTLQLNSIRMDS